MSTYLPLHLFLLNSLLMRYIPRCCDFQSVFWICGPEAWKSKFQSVSPVCGIRTSAACHCNCEFRHQSHVDGFPSGEIPSHIMSPGGLHGHTLRAGQSVQRKKKFFYICRSAYLLSVFDTIDIVCTHEELSLVHRIES